MFNTSSIFDPSLKLQSEDILLKLWISIGEKFFKSSSSCKNSYLNKIVKKIYFAKTSDINQSKQWNGPVTMHQSTVSIRYNNSSAVQLTLRSAEGLVAQHCTMLSLVNRTQSIRSSTISQSREALYVLFARRFCINSCLWDWSSERHMRPHSTSDEHWASVASDEWDDDSEVEAREELGETVGVWFIINVRATGLGSVRNNTQRGPIAKFILSIFEFGKKFMRTLFK